jgi:hypothetical protein
MTALKITAGDITFDAVLEEEKAPLTCAAFRKVMPFSGQIVHVRWSGEGVWIPLGDTDFGVGYENHTSFPSAGQIILYPGGISETEILLAYGGISFASKMGQLAGNHFITLTSNTDRLDGARQQRPLEGRPRHPLRIRLKEPSAEALRASGARP